jgi:hypothetical protein
MSTIVAEDRPLTFAFRLAAVVREHGVGVAEICAATAVSPPTACRRLTGETPFTVPELAEIADTLDVSVSDLVREAEQRA